MIRRPPRSTLFPTRRSSDLAVEKAGVGGPASIFAVQMTDRAAPLEDPFHLPKIKLYRPPHIAPRIAAQQDRKSTRLNSSHSQISYAVFCLKKKKNKDYKHNT